MAYASIMFENSTSGKIKIAPVGFSWTMFFFGFFPALLRGDLKWTLIMILTVPFTAGINMIIFMFIYNKIYIKDLISQGFKAKSISNGEMAFVEGKLGIKIPRMA